MVIQPSSCQEGSFLVKNFGVFDTISDDNVHHVDDACCVDDASHINHALVSMMFVFQ